MLVDVLGQILIGLVLIVIISVFIYIFLKICCGILSGDCQIHFPQHYRARSNQRRFDGGEDGRDHGGDRERDLNDLGGGKVRSGGRECDTKGTDESELEEVTKNLIPKVKKSKPRRKSGSSSSSSSSSDEEEEEKEEDDDDEEEEWEEQNDIKNKRIIK